MRVLLISPREPQTDGKGDATRAAAFVAAIGRNHEVELFVPRASPGRRALAAISDLLAGRPAQLGYSMPPAAWSSARRAAAANDIALAITVRAVRGPLGIPLIIDHVDALSLNWKQRSRGQEGRARRLLARVEARRLGRWEAAVAGWAVGQLAVGAHDAAALPRTPPVTVVPHRVAVSVPAERGRDIDLIFTGNMRYPPNRQAALWLDREILPALERMRPAVRAVIAGRGADRLRLRNATAMANLPSIPAVLVRSRVAIAPLTGIGTGVPTKALEAAACGAALVVTPWVHERLPLPARVAVDAAGLASEVADLLADEPARLALAIEARTALASYGIDHMADQLDSVLDAARNAPPRATTRR